MNTKKAEGLGTQLRSLLELLDGELEQIYARDFPGYRPRYTPVMKALAMQDRLSIKQIAEQSSISHSAASQTVAKMVTEKLVRLSKSQDGRERLVALTARAKRMLPGLQRQWQATQHAADGLDTELRHPLSTTLAEAIGALQQRSFEQRIRQARDEIDTELGR